MKSTLYCAFDAFIKKHNLLHKRCLLALSGGVDSMALFSIAKQFADKGLLEFEVAHIDHGWRPESSIQAKALEKWVEAQGIRFHLYTIETQPLSDKENQARIERIQFFKKITHRHKLKGVLLAHHADDQAETVLKRVFEGSGIDTFQGLLPVRNLDNVLLFRPLLTFEKKVLEKEVKRLNLPVLEDVSNQDIRFLRNRMRIALIPGLEKHFGKSIKLNLNHLAQVSGEIEDLLKQTLEKELHTQIKGPIGRAALFSSNSSPATLRYFLKQWAREEQQVLTQQAIHTLLYALDNDAAHDKHVLTSDWVISRFERAFIFIKKSLLTHPEKIVTLYKSYTCAPEHRVKKEQNWKTFLAGSCYCSIPYDQVLMLSELPKEKQQRIRKWYSTHKVPCVLRNLAPLFFEKRVLVFEPLTGEKRVGFEKHPLTSS
ncbi:tRNA lysidine(34) synthetase TilS [Candidatus Aerophobetes bacterium]|uniref:tRNA(Ile)-lysidine synthase n=1 Tax=Aerophobetes bacterium TaxID=2030807 RepID=A0A2A4X1E0_UNCAE|nr:MAG: tRNA lysidine(34) synthetase TilS [Candidatus Aerophobetes bacterium]